MSDSERKKLKDFLRLLYGNQVDGWSINQGVADVTVKMVMASEVCSKSLDLVPRPMGYGGGAAGYAAKEVGKLVLRKVFEKDRHYAACLKTSAASWKPQIVTAAYGV